MVNADIYMENVSFSVVYVVFPCDLMKTAITSIYKFAACTCTGTLSTL